MKTGISSNITAFTLSLSLSLLHILRNVLLMIIMIRVHCLVPNPFNIVTFSCNQTTLACRVLSFH